MAPQLVEFINYDENTLQMPKWEHNLILIKDAPDLHDTVHQTATILGTPLYNNTDVFVYPHMVSFSNFAYVLAKSFEIFLHHKQRINQLNYYSTKQQNNAQRKIAKIIHHTTAEPNVQTSSTYLTHISLLWSYSRNSAKWNSIMKL